MVEYKHNPAEVIPAYDSKEYRHYLEQVALTIDDEIKSLEESIRVNRETLKIEFTI